MNFTAEQLKKINEAKTAEELIELAKAEGIEMSEEEIKAKFDAVHKEGELADDELDNVAGGCGGDDSYVPSVGDLVVYNPNGQEGTVTSIDKAHFEIVFNTVSHGGLVYTFEPGYEVELRNGTTVWAKDEELSPFTTGAAISF